MSPAAGHALEAIAYHNVSSLIGRLAPLVKLQRLINLHTVSYLEQHSTEGDPTESRSFRSFP